MIHTRIWIAVLATVLLLWGCGARPEERASVPAETTVPETTEAVTEPTAVPTTEAATKPEVFTLTFVGDCTFGSNPANWYAPYGFIKSVGENYDFPFQNVREYFENDDFTMVNLEGALCDEGNPVEKKFNFKGPVSYVNFLTENSIEAVTLANNHTYDYGDSGYKSTVRTLEEAGVPYVEGNSTAVVTTESGLTIGLYAATYASIDMEDLKADVAALREQGVDIIVWAVHWGTEGSYRPAESQTEQAYAAIDAGVDIVYGSHPHVLQKVESYNGGMIYYSLGNFCFGGNLYPRDMDTAILRQQVIREPDGTVRLGELTMIPACVSSIPNRNNFQPTPYEAGSEEYERAMSKLDGTFTGHNLVIN